MSGFANSIVGGVGALIRSWIRSPNYVAGTSGWTINRDGTVEFSNGTFRGTVSGATVNGGTINGTTINSSVINDGQLFIYDGTPAAGNLIASLSATQGNDSFGNFYEAGFGIYADVNNSAYLTVSDQNRNNIATLKIDNATGDFVLNHSPFVNTASLKLVATNGIQFASGKSGLYYYEDWQNFTLGMTSGTVYQINPTTTATHNINSDYGSAYVGGATPKWTCPHDGIYDFSFNWGGLPATSYVGYCRFNLNGAIVAAIGSGTAASQWNASPNLYYRKELVAGDVFLINMVQSSGAAQTLTNTTLSIRRCL